MKLINYFKKAFSEKWAIGQFNFSTLDQLKSIAEASVKLSSPIIAGTSKKEADFFGIEEAGILVSFYRKKYKTPIFLNLDHGRDLDSIKKAIDSGYDMVHFDGSKMELRENIKETKKVLKYAKRKNIIVEGEVGYISGTSAFHKEKMDLSKIKMPTIEEVNTFCSETEIDLLALSIGNIHGIYSQMPELNFSLLKKAHKIVKKGIVFHGGSGVKNRDIKKIIKLGVVKINVNTELRIAWKESLNKTIINDSLFAPYDLLLDSKTSFFNKIQEKIILFGSKNRG